MGARAQSAGSGPGSAEGAPSGERAQSGMADSVTWVGAISFMVAPILSRP